MATREEIQKKYDEEKRTKILQLQTTLSSRTGQAAKQSALVKNGVSIINNVFTPEEFVSTDILGISGDGNRNFIFKSIREGVVKKNSSQEEPFGFIALESKCIVTGFNDKSVTVSYSIEEKSYLFLPSNSGTTGIRILTIPGTITQIQITDTERGFESLRKELSSFIYPTGNIVMNDKFQKHLDAINIILVDINKLPALDTLPVLSYSIFTLGDFNLIFPKPDGLEPSLPQPNVNVPGGTGITVPSTPTPEVPTITGAGTPEVPTTTTVPTTPSIPSPPNTTSVTPQTQQNGSARKYLSIEAIKDDDPVVPTETTSSRVLSLRYLDDAETSTDGYSSSSEINQITTDTARSRGTEPPISPTSEQNKDVLEKEAEELRKRTEAQAKAEESDAVVKEETKEKSSTRPVGGNPELSEGKTAEKDKETPPPSKKEEKAIDGVTIAKTFLEWIANEGIDPNGIIYRNPGSKKVSDPKTAPITTGLVENRYKSFLDYGKNKTKFFGSFSIESPIDVALVMNGIQVGIFNKSVPYMFGEGSEIHLVMVNSSLIREGEGGIGKDGNDANWGERPWWCGIFTNFVLYENGKYVSDKNPYKRNIAGTSSVTDYYLESPFNQTNDFAPTLKSLFRDIESLKTGKKGSLSSNQDELARRQKAFNIAQTNLQRCKGNKEPNQIQSQCSTKQIAYDLKLRELQVIQNEINRINQLIQQKEKEVQLAKTNASKTKKEPYYNEQNTVAIFERGIHIGADDSLTPEGIALYNKIKSWPGAYVVRDGHVEVLLHWSPKGTFYTLGGNTGISPGLEGKGADKENLRIKKAANPPIHEGSTDSNGYQYGFRKTSSAGAWAGSGDLYVVKRGTKNEAAAYTKGIGVSVKKTKTWNQYVDALDKKSNKYDKTVSPGAYNILRNIME